MNFRDFNSMKPKRKGQVYSAGINMRDMNFRPVKKAPPPPEIHEPVPVIPAQPKPPLQPMQSPYMTPPPYQSVPLQSVYVNPHMRPQQSVYTPLQPQQPITPPKPDNQFLYYTNNPAPTPPQPEPLPPPVRTPEPIRPPEPEQRTETPPPKMVKAVPKKPVVRNIENTNGEYGFGGTFDNNDDQTTALPDIPVMNNIDDYKI